MLSTRYNAYSFISVILFLISLSLPFLNFFHSASLKLDVPSAPLKACFSLSPFHVNGHFHSVHAKVDLLDKPALKSVFSSHPEVLSQSDILRKMKILLKRERLKQWQWYYLHQTFWIFRILYSVYEMIDDWQNWQWINSKKQVECVIHFAALKAVGESFTIPLAYYGNNITGACNGQR